MVFFYIFESESPYTRAALLWYTSWSFNAENEQLIDDCLTDRMSLEMKQSVIPYFAKIDFQRGIKKHTPIEKKNTAYNNQL